MTETTAPEIYLDVANTRRLLNEALAEKGEDYVYQPVNGSCHYLEYEGPGKPTGPSCLVGHVLVKAGVPMEQVMEVENATATNAIRDLDIAALPSVVDALDAAQSVQDGGRPWGEAVKAFEASL